MGDEEAALALFKENEDREDLTDFARGRFFMTYIERFNLSQNELARRLDVDVGTVNRCIGIFETSRQVLEHSNGSMKAEAYRHVVTEVKFKEANRLPEEKKVEALAQVAQHDLSTNETKALVRKIEDGKPVNAATSEVLLEREQARTVTYRNEKLTCPTCSGKGFVLRGTIA
jgi:DNA-binding transcriptional regulator YhcF (GntR family)